MRDRLTPEQLSKNFPVRGEDLGERVVVSLVDDIYNVINLYVNNIGLTRFTAKYNTIMSYSDAEINGSIFTTKRFINGQCFDRILLASGRRTNSGSDVVTELTDCEDGSMYLIVYVPYIVDDIKFLKQFLNSKPLYITQHDDVDRLISIILSIVSNILAYVSFPKNKAEKMDKACIALPVYIASLVLISMGLKCEINRVLNIFTKSNKSEYHSSYDKAMDKIANIDIISPAVLTLNNVYKVFEDVLD